MSEWLSINDHVPEYGQRVRYYFDVVGEHEGLYLGVGYCGHVFGGKNGWLDGDVTHWKPISEGESEQESLEIPRFLRRFDD